MRKILAGLLSVLMIFPVSSVGVYRAMAAQAAGQTPQPSPQSQSVTAVQNQMNNDLVSSATTTTPPPSQSGGYQSVPANTAPNNCSAQPIMNAMAGAQSNYLNKASRGVSKHQGVMQTLANQLDVCAKNFLKFAFGIPNSLPGWSEILDQIVSMACSMAGQAVYDALMCLMNGALYGALTGKPFGFCGGYVVNTTMSGGLGVNPSTGQLQLQGNASNGNTSFNANQTVQATPTINTGNNATQRNSTSNVGGTWAPGQGFQGTSVGTTGSGQSIGPGGGVTGTIQKLFQ